MYCILHTHFTSCFRLFAQQAAETEALASRVAELEGMMSSLESEKSEAVLRMQAAVKEKAETADTAEAAVAAEEKLRSEVAVRGLL